MTCVCHPLIGSFAGLFNIICLIPVFPLLHWLGWETFELPPTRQAWTKCLINMCITFSSDYLYVLGTSLPSPTDPNADRSAMLKTTPMRMSKYCTGRNTR
jgi:hypothetical protein